MRKILMTTTALVGVAFAGAAQAATTSPISLNVGGYADFVAGFFHEAQGTSTNGGRASHDFETEYKLSIDALGKASNGVEYGANISLWNGPEATNLWEGGGASTTINSAYVWMSGAFGKGLFGDEHGASDLFVYAPTVGEGQIDGRYRDFVDTRTLAYFQPSGIDNTEHSTKVTYYTPKIGNDSNKVQVGVSFIPNMYDYGQNSVKYTSSLPANTTTQRVSPYQDVIKGAAQYTGTIRPVNITASAQIISNVGHDSSNNALLLGGGLPGSATPAGKAQDFTAWGLGAQAGFEGFTFGASYMDNGSYNTVSGQNKDQDIWTLGGKYEFDKVGVALNYLTGDGYNNLLTGNATPSASNANYVKSFNAYGAGATYTWFPGLTSNVDGVIFTQNVTNVVDKNDGYVFLLSQKLSF